MRKLIYSIAFGIMVLLTSCKKNGSVTTDSIPPVIQFTINGGGFSKTFTGTEDYTTGQLNLKPNTKYTVNLSINDAGGVSRLQMQLDKVLLSHAFTGIPSVTVTETTLEKIYSIFGVSTDPYISFLITGSFVTPDINKGDDISFNIKTNGSDYTPNLVSIHVPCLLTQTPPGGYGWAVL